MVQNLNHLPFPFVTISPRVYFCQNFSCIILILFLQQYGVEVVGMDLSSNMIEIAMERLTHNKDLHVSVPGGRGYSSLVLVGMCRHEI